MLLGSGGLLSWHLGSMRLIALSQSMMLSGTWDGEGSGNGESLVDMSGSLGCLLGCLLMWKVVSVERDHCRNSNILLRSSLNMD